MRSVPEPGGPAGRDPGVVSARPEPAPGWLDAPLWLVAVAAGGVYAMLAEAMVEITSFGTSVGSTFWPGAGVTAALLLRLRFRRWPAVIVAVAAAEFGVDVANGFGALTAVGWAAANTAEAAFGAWLLRRNGLVTVALQEIRVLIRFLACCVLAGPLLGAVVGTLWASLVSGDPVLPRLPRWFLGDAIGVLVVAPALLGLQGRGMASPTWGRRTWSALGLGGVTLIGVGPWQFSADWGLPFLVLAVLVLTTVWLGHGWASAGVLVVAVPVEVLTAVGLGPFAERGAFEGLVIAEMFLAACALTALVVAALTNGLLTQEEVEAVLREQALHDPLTGLANRRLLEERFDQVMSRARREGESVGLAVVDLDHFKAVNDRLGHVAGDAVLVEAAQRMLSEVRAQDTVARLGGDEFAVLLDGLEDPTFAERMATRLTASLHVPMVWEAEPVPLAASVGLVVSDPGGSTLEAMILRADDLMYAEKARRSAS